MQMINVASLVGDARTGWYDEPAAVSPGSPPEPQLQLPALKTLENSLCSTVPYYSSPIVICAIVIQMESERTSSFSDGTITMQYKVVKVKLQGAS